MLKTTAVIRGCLFIGLLALCLLIYAASWAWGQTPAETLNVCINVFILADTDTDLERNAIFPHPDALLGDPDPAIRRLIEAVVKRVSSIWMQCQIGFRQNIIKVIRSGLVLIFGRPLLDHLDLPDTAIPALQASLKLLRGEFERQGLKLFRYRCLHVFIGNLERMVENFADGTATGPDDLISLVHWKHVRAAGRAIFVTAHEIGHNFGLPDIDDPRNLMGGGLGYKLEPWQCTMARMVAADLVFGRPPHISRIEFPAEIPADGTEASGRAFFIDLDGDVELIRFEVLEGDFKPFSFDPKVSWLRSGKIPFSLACKKPQDVTLRVTLVDEMGHVSKPVNLYFKCV